MPLLASVIMYWLIGYQANVSKFFIFTITMVLLQVSRQASTVGIAASSLWLPTGARAAHTCHSFRDFQVPPRHLCPPVPQNTGGSVGLLAGCAFNNIGVALAIMPLFLMPLMIFRCSRVALGHIRPKSGLI